MVDPRSIAPEVQLAMGTVLAFIDMARGLTPPKALSGREALLQYADIAERAAGASFGEEAWAAFVDFVHKQAEAVGVEQGS